MVSENKKYFVLYANETENGATFSVFELGYFDWKRYSGVRVTYHNFSFVTIAYGFENYSRPEHQATGLYLKGLMNGKLRKVGLDFVYCEINKYNGRRVRRFISSD